MTATAKLAHDVTGMNLLETGTGDDEDPAFHTDYDEQDIKVFHVLELVGQRGDITDKMVNCSMGDSDVDAMDIEDGPARDQVVEQTDLFRGQLLDDQVGDDIQVGSVLQKIGSSLIIPDRSRMKGQAAGIFVEAEHHHGRFISRDLDLLLHEDVSQDRDG